MTSKSKGTDFERLLAKLLNENIKNSSWKRVPGSGAIGTNIKEPVLTGDINGKVDSIPRKFKAEAKVGYGGKTQFTLKKEWLDKITAEASSTYSIPLLFGKFSGSRSGVKIFTVMGFDVFVELLNYITKLQKIIETLEKTNE